MIRRHIRLADGRDLFYYDAAGYTPHDEPDRRTDLAAPVGPSDVRWDPLRREHVVIAAHRQTRTFLPPAGQCPLDPATPGAPSEIPGPYQVAVFENRFPAFSSWGADHASPRSPGSMPGTGRSEVVCFTSDHDGTFAELPPDRVRTVIDAWVDRTRDIARMPSVQYVFCFENRGEQIGVTLSHPHGQIYGYPFLPARFATTGETLDRHHRSTGRCLQCDLLDAEVADGCRVVLSSRHWVAYVPYAARWPYELRLVPRRHRADLPALDEPEKTDLAAVYPRLLGAFDRLFDDGVAPYVAGWHQAPVRAFRPAWHLAAEVFTIRRAETKLKYLAGSESGAGVWINDIRPEDAARRLREQLPPSR